MSNIVIDAFNYHAKIAFPEDSSNYKIEFDEELEGLYPSVIINKKRYKYSLIGIYDKSINTYTWSWYLNSHERNIIKSRQLILYALSKVSSTLCDTYVRRLLTTPVIKNINPSTFDLIVSLSVYLIKAHGVLTKEETDGTMHIYVLYDIKEEKDV